jgi:HupE / UreJ protein
VSGVRRGLGVLGALVGTVLAVLLAGPAAAHTRSQSFSSWTIDGTRATVVARLPLLTLAPLVEPGAEDTAALAARIGAYATERLTLRAGDLPCTLAAAPTVLRPAADRFAVEWRLECPVARPLTLATTLLLDVTPSHLHFARVQVDGGPVLERVLSLHESRWPVVAAIAGTEEGGSGIVAYLRLGVAHIASGLDHLAFLLALLLLARSWREVAVVVTGFTAGHSLTLALAALGWLRPEGRTVEALIGLSIAVVAAENVAVVTARSRAVGLVAAGALAALGVARLRGVGGVSAVSLGGLALFVACYFELVARVARPVRLRAVVALLFGLVHGLGFGGLLMEVGLPAGRVIPALLGFNVGVEVGQLAVVAVAWPLLALVVRRPVARVRVLTAGSAALCGVGLYWFVARGFG